MKQSFQITDEFRAFMREVAAKVDRLDERAQVHHECGRGGRVAGSDDYRFMYFERDGHGRWEIMLREQQIREIAAGHVHEIDGVQLDPNTNTMRGEPLIVWGELDDDALGVRSASDLLVALDALHAIGNVEPCVLRLWSTADAQLVAVLNGNDCAIYVVQSAHGYGTSVGDPTRTASFELVDHDIGAISIPWSDCIPWRVARPALLAFAERGELGDGVILDRRIPSQLLMLGDFDRAAELETRRMPPVDPALSSLPDKTPHGEWAARLLRGLVELHLIEIDTSIEDAITAQLTVLLIQLGEDAQDSAETAQQLAKELAELRGVARLFATAGDLQIALRRTQDPPTMPVEVPFT